jgi:hypothetical protein
MRPGPNEVMHFSEDSSIREFIPRRAPTQQIETVHVWAVDAFHAPSYWFPRQCPRAMAWRLPTTADECARKLLGPENQRTHAIEYRWLEAFRTAEIYAYRFDAGPFRPIAADKHAYVCDHTVKPLGAAEPVGDLLALHEAADIELRILNNLWPFWNIVTQSTLGFSGIRLSNAQP